MTPAEYARQYYPKISDNLIEQSYLEILFVMEGQQRCAACMCLDMCDTLLDTSGYMPVMELNANGWISTPMAPCRFNKHGVRPKPAKQKLCIVAGMEKPQEVIETVKPTVQGVLYSFPGQKGKRE